MAKRTTVCSNLSAEVTGKSVTLTIADVSTDLGPSSSGKVKAFTVKGGGIVELPDGKRLRVNLNAWLLD